MKKFVCALLALIMALSLVACGSSTPDKDTVEEDANTETTEDTFRIGAYLAMSGGLAVPGIDARRSMEMAAKYINENGGFNGADVELVFYDTTGSTEEAVKVVQKMVVDDKVDAVVGSVNSTEVAAAIPYLNQQEIWNFGLGTSPSWMEDTSLIWTFRAAPNNGFGMAGCADALLALGFDSVAIMSATDDNGKAAGNAFEAVCKEKGIDVTIRVESDPEETDFSGQIAAVLETEPDVIFQALVGTTIGPAFKQLRNMGYTGMLAGQDSLGIEYQEVIGKDNLQYYFFAYPYVDYAAVEDCDIPLMHEFLQNFYDEYDDVPQHLSASRAWDTMMVMWEASKIAGSNDKNALREATGKVKMEGLGGTIDYTDGDRESYATFNPFIFIDGKYVLLDSWMKSDAYDAFVANSAK